MGDTNGQVRIGIAGCGVIANRHLKQLQAIGPDRIKVTGLFNLNNLSATVLRVRAGRGLGSYPTCHTNYEGLISDSNVDGILILTPHPFHAEMALQALQAGKHVYVEKPLGTSRQWDIVQDVFAEAKARQGKQAFVVAPCEIWPEVTSAMEFVNPKEIGQIVMAEAGFYSQGPLHTWYYLKDLAHDGVISDVAVYGISRFSHMLGPIRSVQTTYIAAGGQFNHCADGKVTANVETAARIVLSHMNGIKSLLKVGWTGKDQRIDYQRIDGSNGGIYFNLPKDPRPVLIDSVNPHTRLADFALQLEGDSYDMGMGSRWYDPHFGLSKPDQRQMGYFLRCVTGEATPDLEHSYHICEALRAAYQSWHQSFKTIDLDSTFKPHFEL